MNSSPSEACADGRAAVLRTRAFRDRHRGAERLSGFDRILLFPQFNISLSIKLRANVPVARYIGTPLTASLIGSTSAPLFPFPSSSPSSLLPASLSSSFPPAPSTPFLFLPQDIVGAGPSAFPSTSSTTTTPPAPLPSSLQLQ
jgi:hypothetical protein